MKILGKCILLFLFTFSAYGDVAQCVADYNEAVKERNNANGSHITAQNYQRRALSDAERSKAKELYTKSVEWLDVAMANLARAEKMLDKVKNGGCPETLVENAGSLTQKNFTDKATFETMKREIETKISLFQ
jgi:hypothetical protein